MDARFRSNLDMIGRNEPITRKAKFWQSYVRALKGTDDIRAPEHTHRPRSIFRSDYPELSATWPFGKSIFENPLHAADRINVPGYRYLPVHREIYGYSPRQIYPHQYKPVERFTPGTRPDKWLLLNRVVDSSGLRRQQIARHWQTSDTRQRNTLTTHVLLRHCIRRKDIDILRDANLPIILHRH